MTREEKSAIRQYRFDGVNYAKIAEKLGLPEGTVKSFCSRNQLRAADIRTTASARRSCKQCGQPLQDILKKKTETVLLRSLPLEMVE